MAQKTRILGQSAPKGPMDWDRLLRQAIERADLTKDTRAIALRNALAQGRAAEILKKMGIIGENDLNREFPSPPT